MGCCLELIEGERLCMADNLIIDGTAGFIKKIYIPKRNQPNENLDPQQFLQ